MTQLIESMYFGCISSFSALYNADIIELEYDETFQKMSFRNRCQILGARKVINLSVPILGGRDQKSFTKEVLIDNTQKWQLQHWRTLESCYNKSAFFLHYAPGLHQIIFGGHTQLWDLNEAALRWTMKHLRWKGIITHSKEYIKDLPPDVGDCRNRFLPSNRNHFQLIRYQQVFGEGFENNLSILDLLFNLGPQAGAYLKDAKF